jgi:AraC family transcriptional regulator of adaptative response/methylated-DNA-[protein]-cysteine methyltransferase
MTPAIYRKGGKGMKINFTVLECPLGKLLVAATSKGICSVAFGDDAEILETNLRQEFAAAQVTRCDEYLSDYAAAILENIAGERKILQLPVDVQATVFQARVWAEIKKIPYGETRSYKEIAENLGNAKAVRAYFDENILNSEKRHYVDSGKWKPLIMSFCEFYGLGENLHPSKLAKVF